MKKIQWSRAKLASFKACYNRAVTAGETDFYFEDDEFYTPYAKYLIEYLDMHFKPDTREIERHNLSPQIRAEEQGTVTPYLTTTKTEDFVD